MKGTISAHRNSKLTQEDVRRIKTLHMQGMTNIEISKEFPVNSSSIQRITSGLSWSEIVVEKPESKLQTVSEKIAKPKSVSEHNEMLVKSWKIRAWQLLNETDLKFDSEVMLLLDAMLAGETIYKFEKRNKS